MNGRKVMIAHAAAVMRKIVKSSLIACGFEVVGEVASGLEAVATYRSVLPDVVTMDLFMPGLDGIEAVRAIVSEFPNARIIICTATSEPEVVCGALQAGARSFIMKPFPPAKLVEIIVEMLATERHA